MTTMDGAALFEAITNRKICENQLNPQLCFATRDRRFWSAFGISSETCHLIWTILDTNNNGPLNAMPMHLLWTLYWLKNYPTQEVASTACGVKRQSFKKWRDAMIEALTSLDVVSHMYVLFVWQCNDMYL